MGLGLELEDRYDVGNTSLARINFLFLDLKIKKVMHK